MPKPAISPFLRRPLLVALAIFGLAAVAGYALRARSADGGARAARELAETAPIDLGGGRFVIESAPPLRPLGGARPLAAGPSAIDTGHGFSYVIDSLAGVDGVVELSYHIEGDTTNLVGIGFGLVAVDANGTTLALARRPTQAFLGESLTVQVTLADVPTTAAVYLPSAVRLHQGAQIVNLEPAGTGRWEGHLDVLGETLALIAEYKDGFVSVVISGQAGGATIVDGRLIDYELRDAGTPLEDYHGSSSYPTPGDMTQPLSSSLDFIAPPDLSGGPLTLEISGFGELLRSDWQVDITP